MDDDIRRQIGQLFGDAPAPPPLSKQNQLTAKLRAARETELHRLARQDEAVQKIRALAAAAGIEVSVLVPPSPLRAKVARDGHSPRGSK